MGIRLIFLLVISITLTGCWPFDSDNSNPSPVTYSAEFIDPPTPIMQACDGEITLSKIISVCKNNSSQIVDNINCNNLFIPQITFKSPPGEQVDLLVNDDLEIIGNHTFTCGEGKNRANSEVVGSCSDERYKLKGESNQRDSFCKHFPIKLSVSARLTCIEFSDQTYKCTGQGLNDILKPFIEDTWEIEETNYLRDIPYFKGSQNLKIGNGRLSSAIKNNKIISREFIGIESGNNGLDSLIVGPGLGSGFSYYCYVNLFNKLKCKGYGPSFGMGTILNSFVSILENEEIIDLHAGRDICVKNSNEIVKCANSTLYLYEEIPEFFNYKKMFLSEANTCVITQDNKVKCRGVITNSSNVEEIEEMNEAVDLAIGNETFCGLINSKVYCLWYDYSNNQVSVLQEQNNFQGARKIYTNTDFSSSINSETQWTFCAIMDNDNVKCTGTNDLGQLGTRDLLPRIEEPVTIWEF